jgi:DNA polymerase-3 subunit delta'
MRIDDNNYPDFIVLDGSKDTIKKEAVGNIETQFEKTPFESKGKMIYIIHLVETMRAEAINSILKFLEEPGSEIYAFLTTNNESSVLPTIISRCQVLRLKLVNRKEVIEDAIGLNVPQEDAELLSYFYNDGELIYDVLNDEDECLNYASAKKAFVEFMDALNKEDKREAIYYSQKNIIPLVKTKESARFFLDMLVEGFEDILNIQQGKSPILQSYGTILKELSDKLAHVDESLIEILKDRNLINLNVNTSLLMDHLVFSIIEEK